MTNAMSLEEAAPWLLLTVVLAIGWAILKERLLDRYRRNLMDNKIKRTDKAATILAAIVMAIAIILPLSLLFGLSALVWCQVFSMMGGM